MLDSLTFDNSFTRCLPADTEMGNFTREVMHACYSRVLPTKVVGPKLVAYSREVAEMLGLSESACKSEEFTQVFAGNQLLKGMDAQAQCYGGHQFGHWAGQLGDGRAINLGEVVNANGDRLTLQLKGAGPTPYSRSADGLAVLRSSVREFLCSEAMHHLGVPTTRALSLVTTGEQVARDMFYDGNAKMEPGAVVCRVAQSFTRFGNFQIFAARNDTDVLKQLVDYTIRTDFPELGEPSPAVYLAWLEQVFRTTAEMIVHWMRVGFVHGVMNTDNMSILGLTIDYGPYGWLENYDPNWTPNTTDAMGRRYCFGNQPHIALWNLQQLANSIAPLIGNDKAIEQALGEYSQYFAKSWWSMMATKLGFDAFDPDTDEQLITDLIGVLQVAETDMTIFFRKLAQVEVSQLDKTSMSEGDKCATKMITPLLDAYYAPDDLTSDNIRTIEDWLMRYKERVARDGNSDALRQERMNAVNPKYVLRNYLAQLAIDKAEQGDDAMVNELLDVLRRPYDEQPENETFARKRPEWARHKAGCSTLSCSS